MQDSDQIRKRGLRQIGIATLFAANILYSYLTSPTFDLDIIYLLYWPALSFALVFFVNGLALYRNPIVQQPSFAPRVQGNKKSKIIYTITAVVLVIFSIFNYIGAMNADGFGALGYILIFAIGGILILFIGFLLNFLSRNNNPRIKTWEFFLFSLFTFFLTLQSIFATAMSLPEVFEKQRMDENAVAAIEQIINLEIGSSLSALHSLLREPPEIIPEGYNRYSTETGGNYYMRFQPYSLQSLNEKTLEAARQQKVYISPDVTISPTYKIHAEASLSIRRQLSLLNGLQAISNCGSEVLLLSSTVVTSGQKIQLLYVDGELVYKQIDNSILSDEKLFVANDDMVLVCGAPYQADDLRGIIDRFENGQVHLRHVYLLLNYEDDFKSWLENNEELQTQWNELIYKISFE